MRSLRPKKPLLNVRATHCSRCRSPRRFLSTGDALQLDEGVILRVLTRGESGAALVLEYGNLRIFLPNDAPPGDLPDLTGRILLLSEADWQETTVEEWQRAGPLAVVVFGLPPQPCPPGWLSTTQNGRVEIVSDGEKMNILADNPLDGAL